MVEFESVRERYTAIVPALQVMCDDLEKWLRDLTLGLGILEPRIEGRVKKPHSLLLKALRKEVEGNAWSDPLIEANDKVGVRADLVYKADVERLVQAITAAGGLFDGDVRIDDKLQSELGVDKLGYHGVHFDVIPRNRPASLPRDLARCEIQVRTNAQAAWAMATHDLLYKAPVEPGDELRRRVNRLTVLLECFDDDVARTRDEMMGERGYPVAIVLGALEAARMRFPIGGYDRELSRDIVTALVGDIDAEQAHALGREVEVFAAESMVKLGSIFSRSGLGHPLLGQPEAILVFMQLEQAPLALRERWAEADLPHRLLDELAAEWGATVPEPL